MKTYLVGGAVRDMHMGKKPKDRDYVVVGASVQDMLDKGFHHVGESFPVFLHPDRGGEEYALARKERKIDGANAHKAFVFDTDNVTIEEDLYRRDLTINAMALQIQHMDDEPSETFEFHDPYGGRADIANKVLRHVSEAFEEDPLRVLRVAKFAARFPDFTIADRTIDLMKKVVRTDGFKSLPAERVYKEMISALSYDKPSIFFEVLRYVGGLSHFFPELEKLIGVPQNPIYHPEGDCWIHTMLVLDHAASMKSDYRMEIVFSALVHDLGKGITPVEILPKHIEHEKNGVPLVEEFCRRLKVPNNLRDAALIVTSNHLRVHRIGEATASSIVRMLIEIGAFKKPHVVEILARACEADDMGKNRENVVQGLMLEEYFNHVKDVSSKDIRQGLKGESIGHEIRATRVRMLKKHMAERTKDEMVQEEGSC
jgi:tRNA nucleotidyltransferase (CCA-adding enzyme)